MLRLKQLDDLNRSLDRIREAVAALGVAVATAPRVPSPEAQPRDAPSKSFDSLVGPLVTLGGLYIAANAFVVNAHPLSTRLVIAGAAFPLAAIYALAVWQGRHGPWLRSLTVALVGIIILAAGIVQVVSWRSDHSTAANEAQIRSVIFESNAMVMDWYKHPDKEPNLAQFFLTADQGGDRIPQIEEIIQRLKANNRRYADVASGSAFIVQISLAPDEKSATVETSEMWYSPLVVAKDGHEEPVPLDSGQINQYTPQQFYVLVKRGDHWYIKSNPVPISPAPPTSTAAASQPGASPTRSTPVETPAA